MGGQISHFPGSPTQLPLFRVMDSVSNVCVTLTVSDPTLLPLCQRTQDVVADLH